MMQQTDNSSAIIFSDIQHQRNEWRKKGWSIPELRGGKQAWFPLVTGLIKLLGEGQINDLNTYPQINGIKDSQSWRSYASFLKGLGFVTNQGGVLGLSASGMAFHDDPTKRHLADLIQDKFRLFGESLEYLALTPSTVEELDQKLCENYALDWNNLSNTRKRMDWLEMLDLIQNIGNRKWAATSAGKDALKDWCLIRPGALEFFDSEASEIEIAVPPAEIAMLLQNLADSPELHKKRCTYNIWVPSPNRIENLRTILQYASERIARNDLFHFISEEFKLKASSVDSMLPFLKASGLLEEVGRNVYVATPAAKAWLETGNDLDFVRILHANMRFVGEMIRAANEDIVRNEIYAQAKQHGLNAEKGRWIAGFLLEAGLLEEPQYLHLKATPVGRQFVLGLPLMSAEDLDDTALKADRSDIKETVASSVQEESSQLTARLYNAARDPYAEGRASGVAFEEAIAEIFNFMGFNAKRIGGSGDTDVVVCWKDSNGKKITAIIDGKSKSGGFVSHGDISDVAIDAHKDKNNANYVAIVGPGFSGDTIRNHAKKKSFALITDEELSEIAKHAHSLGLTLQEISLIFQVPNGLFQLAELISSKQRELTITSNVISRFRREQDELGGLSPRDLFLLLRNTDDSPSLEELLNVFETLSKPEIGVLTTVTSSRSPENTAYALTEGKRAVNRLRALASAIDRGLFE